MRGYREAGNPTPEEYAQRQAERRNELEYPPRDGVDCPKCLNRGFITEARGLYLVNIPCECQKIRRSIREIRLSGLQDLLKIYTFDTYQTPDRWQADIKRAAINFLTDYERNWFCALGAVGSGKTHICTAICGHFLREGKSVRYMLWRDVCRRLKSVVTDDEDYDGIMQPLKDCDVLYIDDFFKVQQGKDPTPGDVNVAFELLNHRYNNPAKITLISSELSANKILYADEAVGSRIHERSKRYLFDIGGEGKNWRLRY
jgi:DNA replication protein DnaC